MIKTFWYFRHEVFKDFNKAQIVFKRILYQANFVGKQTK